MMNIIPLFVAIPLGIAFLVSLFGRLSEKTGDILANLATFSLLILSIVTIGKGIVVYKMGGWGAVAGIPIGIYLVLDGLSALLLAMINVVGFLVCLYSVNYMTRYTDKTKYYTLFLLMIAGMNGVVLSGDLFNMFVFLEIAAIASYALVAFGTEEEELEAAFKYQVMGTVASGFILLGIILIYSLTGTLNLADIAGAIAAKGINSAVYFVGALFLVGFGLKAAIMPMHAWLPDAHPSAPAPISAMLSGLLIKAVGVYALCRIFFNVLGFGQVFVFLRILLVLGIVSLLCGSLLAIGQRDLKRLLAYSSISQIGYIIFAFGLGTPLGILGGLFHLLNHSVFKSLLFLNSGAVVYRTNTRDLEKLGGLSKQMPVTGSTFLIGSLSISGIPPFAGFWSKLIIILAAIQAGYIGLAMVAILASIITLAYYLKAQKSAFLGKLPEAWEKVKEVPVLMRSSMVVLAVLCVVLGFLLLPNIRTFVLDPAVDVLKNGILYSRLILGG